MPRSEPLWTRRTSRCVSSWARKKQPWNVWRDDLAVQVVADVRSPPVQGRVPLLAEAWDEILSYLECRLVPNSQSVDALGPNYPLGLPMRALDHRVRERASNVVGQLGPAGAQDHVQAHMWLNLAADQGDTAARESRDELAKNMAPAQLAEAEKMAREWRARHPQ